MANNWLSLCLLFLATIASCKGRTAREVSRPASDQTKETDSIRVLPQHQQQQEAAVQPVRYNGAQLWRIAYDSQVEKNAVAELQDRFGKDCFPVLRFCLPH
uniref:Putative zinc carboxypeptidase n=1 Tax=Anopheles darlingi TaxID=43151 RepID=A0A2M4DP27_ANODA